MRLMILLLLSLAAVQLPAPPASAGPNSKEPLVLLISIDGLMPDYVLRPDKHGLRIPNLRRLAAEGVCAQSVRGVVPTVTYPSHTTIVTGVAPAQHGIVANKPFDPAGNNLGGWMWYAEDIHTPTLWDAAAASGLTTGSVNWPVTVGAKITWNIVQYWRAGTADDRKLIRALSTPRLVEEAERMLGPLPDGLAEDVAADRRRAAFTMYMIERKKPHLQLCYLAGLDHVQHEHGPDSPESTAALEELDALVGELWTTARRVAGRRVYVCVVSDHGFAKVDRTLHLNAALQRAGFIHLDAGGKVASWSAFAWNAGGSAAIVLHDPEDEALAARVKAALDELASDPANGIQRILDRRELVAMGAFPGAAFVVGVRPGFQVGGNLQPPIVEATGRKGTHGFLPELSEMDAAFFLAGPHVPRGANLGRIDMRDIAPTLAALLNVQLPQAEGKVLLRKATENTRIRKLTIPVQAWDYVGRESTGDFFSTQLN